jgi:hypothetical protein
MPSLSQLLNQIVRAAIFRGVWMLPPWVIWTIIAMTLDVNPDCRSFCFGYGRDLGEKSQVIEAVVLCEDCSKEDGRPPDERRTWNGSGTRN